MKEGAVRVGVTFGDFVPGCISIEAADAKGAGKALSTVLRRDYENETSLTVAVFRDSKWSNALQLTIRTYETECSGNALETFSTSAPMTLRDNTISEWTVQLSAVDEDDDGYAATSSFVNGTDCDDEDSVKNPAAIELCVGSGIDLDCDGLTGCQDSECVNFSCDDLDVCTTNDVCQAAGGCRGTTYSCPAPSECYLPGACDGSGGCTFVPQVGALCSNGRCNEIGECIATGPFPYIPSNFIPGSFAPAEDSELTDDCEAEFDSTSAGFTAWCHDNPIKPEIHVVPNGNLGEAVVLATNDFTMASTARLTLVGDRPVILAIYGNGNIQGDILANSSRLPLRVGAGANVGCTSSTGAPGQISGNGGSGGGGGGNLTPGGRGGNVSGSGGGMGGISRTPVRSPLRGGCPGGSGAGGSEAPGGRGGGSLQISAAGILEIDSKLSVSGAGGARGDSSNGDINAGGGGGGSGGTLLLEANRLIVLNNARLTANGGGGGGGSFLSTANGGENGNTDSTSQAAGGNGQENGGDGGDGAAGTGAAEDGGSTTNRGAGGGGGGAGAIFLRHFSMTNACTIQAGVISPEPTERFNCP